MILIPTGVDVPLDRRPIVNVLLIVMTVAAFGLQFMAMAENADSISPYVLEGWTLTGLFGHMFLHGGLLHLGGNMLFLWVFGNAVCSKVGNITYLPMYLFLGLVAAFAHLFFAGGSAIGASGAINGIVGMFLVLYGLNDIHCLFFIWAGIRPYYSTFSVSSFWMILYWLAFDIAGIVLGHNGVAYFAHLGGFAGGVILAVALLKLRVVKMVYGEKSLVDVWDQWQQTRLDEKLQKEAMRQIEKAKKAEASELSPKRRRPPKTVVLEETMIKFLCPCGQRIKAPAQYAGKRCKCPKCYNQLLIPQTDAASDKLN